MKKILSIGIVRGLIGQAIGWAVGVGLVSAIRAALGLGYKAEPAFVVGAAFSIIAFLIGIGGFRDWWRWAKGEETLDPAEMEEPAGGQRYWGWSVDHKVIGVQYLFLALFLLVVGGSFALMFRVELVQTGMQWLSLDFFNTLIGMHGMVLIVSILMGISAMSNYIVPLQIGAKDMAFPRMNAFAFWLAVPASVVLEKTNRISGLCARRKKASKSA